MYKKKFSMFSQAMAASRSVMQQQFRTFSTKAAEKTAQVAVEKAVEEVAPKLKTERVKLRDLPVVERYTVRINKLLSSKERYEKRYQKLEQLESNGRKIFDPIKVNKDKVDLDARITELDTELKRLARLQKSAERKQAKIDRLAQIPSSEELLAMPLQERLNLFVGFDDSLRQPYHLYARNLKYSNSQLSFTEYMSSWKNLSPLERQPYIDAIASIKDKKSNIKI